MVVGTYLACLAIRLDMSTKSATSGLPRLVELPGTTIALFQERGRPDEAIGGVDDPVEQVSRVPFVL